MPYEARVNFVPVLVAQATWLALCLGASTVGMLCVPRRIARIKKRD